MWSGGTPAQACLPQVARSGPSSSTTERRSGNAPAKLSNRSKPRGCASLFTKEQVNVVHKEPGFHTGAHQGHPLAARPDAGRVRRSAGYLAKGHFGVGDQRPPQTLQSRPQAAGIGPEGGKATTTMTLQSVCKGPVVWPLAGAALRGCYASVIPIGIFVTEAIIRPPIVCAHRADRAPPYRRGSAPRDAPHWECSLRLVPGDRCADFAV